MWMFVTQRKFSCTLLQFTQWFLTLNRLLFLKTVSTILKWFEDLSLWKFWMWWRSNMKKRIASCFIITTSLKRNFYQHKSIGTANGNNWSNTIRMRNNNLLICSTLSKRSGFQLQDNKNFSKLIAKTKTNCSKRSGSLLSLTLKPLNI